MTTSRARNAPSPWAGTEISVWLREGRKAVLCMTPAWPGPKIDSRGNSDTCSAVVESKQHFNAAVGGNCDVGYCDGGDFN